MFMTSEIDFREFAGSVGTIKDYEDDDAIFREGHHPAFMYVVLSGAVDIAAQNKRLKRIGAGNALASCRFWTTYHAPSQHAPAVQHSLR